MWPISSELTAGKSVRWSLPQTRRQQRMKASALAALVVRSGVCGWAWSDLLSSHQPHTGADITDVGKCGISVRDHFSFCLNSVQVLRLGTAANEQRSEKAPGSQVLLLEEDFHNYMSLHELILTCEFQGVKWALGCWWQAAVCSSGIPCGALPPIHNPKRYLSCVKLDRCQLNINEGYL